MTQWLDFSVPDRTSPTPRRKRWIERPFEPRPPTLNRVEETGNRNGT